jgi:hypothetical protein
MIYISNETVKDMQYEFKDRFLKKRRIVDKMTKKCKEYSLQDVTLICNICQTDLAPLKTLEYINDDAHQVKVVFGNLKLISIEKAKNYQDDDTKEFV